MPELLAIPGQLVWLLRRRVQLFRLRLLAAPRYWSVLGLRDQIRFRVERRRYALGSTAVEARRDLSVVALILRGALRSALLAITFVVVLELARTRDRSCLCPGGELGPACRATGPRRCDRAPACRDSVRCDLARAVLHCPERHRLDRLCARLVASPGTCPRRAGERRLLSTPWPCRCLVIAAPCMRLRRLPATNADNGGAVSARSRRDSRPPVPGAPCVPSV